MKVISTQENLKTGLQVISRIVGNSTTLPILNNVLLKTENGSLKISGTNLEIGISTTVRCKVENEGSICLNMKTFFDLVNSLNGQAITIETDQNNKIIISTEKTVTKINYSPADEFPIIPEVEGSEKMVINSEELYKALNQVVFAASSSETQPEISGVLFWFGTEKVLLTATDRFRLAEKSLSYKGNIEDKKIIIPQKSILEIIKLLSLDQGQLEINISSSQLSFFSEDTYLVTRLIDGQYPPYQQIIPDSHNTEVKVEKQELLSAIKTSSVFSSRTGSIVLDYNDQTNIIKISAVSGDLGESLIEIPAMITKGSGKLTINYRYVLDFLNTFPEEELLIKIIDDSNPIVFSSLTDSSYLYLVMPIKQ